MQTSIQRGFSITEAGRYIGGNTSRTTAYKLIADGELTSYHIGVRHYVTKESLDSFINQRIDEESE
jgi:excisionase family DNA binding protein